MIKCAPAVTPDALILCCALANTAGGWLAEGRDIPDLVITAGSNGTHMPHSRHGTYQALDVRSKTFQPADKLPFLRAVIARLGTPVAVTTPTGPGYQTANGQWLGILEYQGQAREHYHVERN